MFSWRPVQHGATDQSVMIRIIDSTDGTPEEGVTSATSGIDLRYRRGPLGAETALTESDLAAITSTHSDGGIKHIREGYYRVDVPDAAFATGVNEVFVYGEVTNMIVIGTLVPLVPYNPYTDVLGTPVDLGGGTATIAGMLQDIEAQTDDIGAAGAGLTAADNAILAVLGALNDAAADGAVTTTDTMVSYLKQIINTLEGAPGIPTFPAAAVAANGVSIAEVLRSIDSRIPSALNNGVIPADVQRINNAEIVGDGSATPFDVA